MRSWSKWLGIGAAVGIILALVPVVRGRIGDLEIAGPLAKLEAQSQEEEEPKVDLSGLDLTNLRLHPRRVTSPLASGNVAELTLDPQLQRTARSLMKRYRIPEAGAVLMDVRTGNILVYASYVNQGKSFDVNARAEAPAASVFKVITGAALVEQAGLSASTEQCYHGGRSRISASELKEDPERDRWCASIAMAMGRSINVVFARLAQKHLTPEGLTAMGGAFGFGVPLPFPVENEAPKIEIPVDPVDFARTSAGFWNTSLSPLAAASVAQTVANGGVTLEPRIVSKVLDGRDVVWSNEDKARVLRHAIKPATAKELTTMMVQTVASGSAFKTFHDKRRNPFLPGIQVAGKTGTLTRHKQNRHYTWFVGFAPADKPEVAVSALVVNTPMWRIKGPHLARDVLRAYFAKQGRRGVTAP